MFKQLKGLFFVKKIILIKYLNNYIGLFILKNINKIIKQLLIKLTIKLNPQNIYLNYINFIKYYKHLNFLIIIKF